MSNDLPSVKFGAAAASAISSTELRKCLPMQFLAAELSVKLSS